MQDARRIRLSAVVYAPWMEDDSNGHVSGKKKKRLKCQKRGKNISIELCILYNWIITRLSLLIAITIEFLEAMMETGLITLRNERA